MPTLLDLVRHLPAYQIHGPNDPSTVHISQIVMDNRAVVPGSLFVAVTGQHFDGHTVLQDAAARGAVALMGQKSPAQLLDEGLRLPPLPYIQTPDSRRDLATCCAALYGFPSRPMITVGVTGTDGKTTTCNLLEAILARATRSEERPAGRAGVISTVGARICGQAQPLDLHVTTPAAPEVQRFLAQMRDAGCAYAIVESTSFGLAQHRVAAVEFDVAAVTNITHEHLDVHGTWDAYVDAKAILFRMLYASAPKAGVPKVAVLNADDEGSFGALQAALTAEASRHAAPVPVRTYGFAPPAVERTTHVWASDVVYAPNHTRFQLHWWGGEFAIETVLIGEFNVYNILCAATVTLALGIDPATIQAGVADLRGVLGRMERIDGGQPFLAIVDFAHSPASLERALLTLRPLVQQGGQSGGRIIAVFGSAGLRDKAKRQLMGQVSGRLADFTVITAEDPRTEKLDEINRAIAAGVRQQAGESAFTIVPDRAEAIRYAVEMAQPGDIVVSFGKGHERSICYGETEYPWNEQQVMAEALRRRFGPA